MSCYVYRVAIATLRAKAGEGFSALDDYGGKSAFALDWTVTEAPRFTSLEGAREAIKCPFNLIKQGSKLIIMVYGVERSIGADADPEGAKYGASRIYAPSADELKGYLEGKGLFYPD